MPAQLRGIFQINVRDLWDLTNLRVPALIRSKPVPNCPVIWDKAPSRPWEFLDTAAAHPPVPIPAEGPLRMLDPSSTRCANPSRTQQTPEALKAFHKAEIEKRWPILEAAAIRAE